MIWIRWGKWSKNWEGGERAFLLGKIREGFLDLEEVLDLVSLRRWLGFLPVAEGHTQGRTVWVRTWRGWSSETHLETMENQFHLASACMVCAKVLKAANSPGYILLLVLNRKMRWANRYFNSCKWKERGCRPNILIILPNNAEEWDFHLTLFQSLCSKWWD